MTNLSGSEIIKELTWRESSELWLEYGVPREDSVYTLIASYFNGWEDEELDKALDLVEALAAKDWIGALVLSKNNPVPKAGLADETINPPFILEVWKNITYAY